MFSFNRQIQRSQDQVELNTEIVPMGWEGEDREDTGSQVPQVAWEEHPVLQMKITKRAYVSQRDGLRTGLHSIQP